MLPNPKSLLPPRYPFKNLVFQGGGVKSYVYHGVLQVMDEYGILPQIERVAGASAGALQAALLSFRLSVDETIKLYKTVDFSQIRSRGAEDQNRLSGIRFVNAQLNQARGNLDTINRFFSKYGLYPMTHMKNWLHQTIAAYCDGNGQASFTDFQARGFRDLYITAVNLNRHKAEIFSADTTPDVAVADAVLMSSAVPFFFEAIRFDGKSTGNGDYYVDGGALSNYPLTIFDDPKFKKGSRYFTYGVNWETLGCQLYTPEEYQRKVEITNILHYAENLIETLADIQNVAVEMRTADRWRSIRISNCGVGPTDFTINPDESDPKYVEMVQTGAQTARQYLEDYHLPTDRFAEIRERLSEILDILHD
jgi:NTE family protein